MTQGKRLFLICKTLLLPFTDPSFGREDPLLQKTQIYAKFLYGQGREHELYHAHRTIQDRLLHELQRDISPERLDELYQLLAMFYGDDLLLEALQQAEAAREATSFLLDRFYLTRIQEISDSFITLRDGRPALRNWHNASRKDLFPEHTNMHKAELWNMLLRESTPDLWIASYYASIDIHDLNELRNVPDEPLLADRVLMRRLTLGLADTHIHFHAGLNYQIQWELVTDVTALRWEKPDRERLRAPLQLVLKAGLLRLFLADYVHSRSQATGEDFLKLYQPLLPSEIYDVLEDAVYNSNPTACDRYFQHFETCTNTLLAFFSSLPTAHTRKQDDAWSDLLSKTVYAKQTSLNTSCDILLFFEALRLAEQPERPILRHALLQYIRLKNTFFQQNTQAETIHGLRKFREYYGRAVSVVFSLRRPELSVHLREKSISQSIFRSYCRQPYIRLLEAKISPPVPAPQSLSGDPIGKILYKNKVRKQLHTIFSAYYDLLTQLAESHAPNESIPQTLDRLQAGQIISIPTFGVIYHFIKADHHRKLYRQVCWADDAPDKAESPFYTETLRNSAIFFSDTLTELFSEIPYLAEYVVGLDAASDELHNEPWVYAPIFNHARRKGNTFPIHTATRTTIPNLGLTYHVGEEFRTLLSGLRAVDEVIEHFGYKAGDRLGHALALQVDPQLWQQNNVVAIQPQIEYLENLLWVWHIKSQFASEAFAAAIPDLEFKIMETAAKLYPRSESLSPYLLWRGYQLKFERLDQQRIQALRGSNAPCSYFRQHSPDACAHCTGAQPKRVCRLAAEQAEIPTPFTWTEYDLLLTHFCPLYTQRFHTPRFVTTSSEEIAMLTELQRYIKHKIERLGITIEVNPTSNASIGEMPHLFAHPLLNLNNRGLGQPDQSANHLSISINTDDPLVFRTTIENEISYIYYMLMEMGYSQTDVLDWIDQIRKFSFDSSFIRREKLPSVQYQELKTLIDALDISPL